MAMMGGMGGGFMGNNPAQGANDQYSHQYQQVSNDPSQGYGGGGGGPGGMMGNNPGGQGGGGQGGMMGGGPQGGGMMGGMMGGGNAGGQGGPGYGQQGGVGGAYGQQGTYGAPGAYDMNGQPGMGPQGYQTKMQSSSMINMLLFAAACGIMLGSFISFLALAFTFSVVDLVSLIYIFIFGFFMATLDTPMFKTLKMVGDINLWISKYVNILTRVTGKGVCFVFLGSSLLSVMWNNLSGSFLTFMGVTINLFVIGVGLVIIVIGWFKSQKLNKSATALRNGILENRYNNFARTMPGPQGGLTTLEFNHLTTEQGGFEWADADLQAIFQALVSIPSWRNWKGRMPGEPAMEAKIPLKDLQDWVNGGMVWL